MPSISTEPDKQNIEEEHGSPRVRITPGPPLVHLWLRG
jgi:hypothetical protein